MVTGRVSVAGEEQARPDISVVVPTYNYAHFLPRAIGSVLSQQDVDVEIIVVDDGSTDDTQQVLGAYEGRIQVLKQNNQGAPTARNLGLQKARGEYILFLDADDWLQKNALSSRLNYLRQHPECDWVYGPYIYYDEEGNEVSIGLDHSVHYARQGNILGYLLLGELIVMDTVVVKCGLIKELGGFRVDLPALQDYELWLRLAAISPIGFVGDADGENKLVVVTHPGSLSRRKDGYRTLLMLLEEAEERYSQDVLRLGYAWRKRIARILLERAAHLLVDGEREQARSCLIRAARKNPLQWKTYYYLLRSLA